MAAKALSYPCQHDGPARTAASRASTLILENSTVTRLAGRKPCPAQGLYSSCEWSLSNLRGAGKASAQQHGGNQASQRHIARRDATGLPARLSAIAWGKGSRRLRRLCPAPLNLFGVPEGL